VREESHSERRQAEDRAGRLDFLAAALLVGLAALLAISALGTLGRIPDALAPGLLPSPVPMLSAAGGLVAAAVLVALALGRLRRAAWSRPAAVAVLVVLIGLLLLGGTASPDLTRVALPVACLAMLLVVLQRRGHAVAPVTSPDFALGALLAVTFSVALLVQRLFG
jgi:membrane associated rhomboid family serine protease